MRIEVLGPLRVGGDGTDLGPRDRVVLEALAVQPGRALSADRLADALWGDAPPSSWSKVVQGCVVRLRRTLGTGAIATERGAYRLVLDGDDLDATHFEHLVERGRSQASTGEPERAVVSFTRALGLWRGAPFEDLDAWSPGRSEAARLQELRRVVEEDRLEARLASGEHREVAAEAEACVAEEPFRERRWASLALAQWRCARQADALRTLQRARHTLVEQLGVEPGPELVALEAAILRHDPSLTAVPEPAPPSTSCPYKGLAPYEASDADSFFGREEEVVVCVDRLAATPLLVVTGPSGSGKSSLVRAGVTPALLRSGRAVVTIVPGADPDAAVSAALAIHENVGVLVVDQMEETFALNDHTVARRFCGRLASYAIEQAPVIVTIRSDHLASLSSDPRFADLAERGLHLVRPLEGNALRAAIEGPAAQAGLRLENGVVDLLLRDIEGEPGALPLMSHALAETWSRREGRVLTVEGYQATGGIRASVARSADRLYESLQPDERAILRSLMLRMVAPTADGDPVRARIAARTLTDDPSRGQVLSLLVRSRLVTTEQDTVELAHEALARAWPRLRSWLEEDAEGQKTLRHLAAAADGWQALDRAPSELYRGARLEQAVEWRADARPDLTTTEREFLDASTAAAKDERAALSRQNRRLRRLLVGVGVFLVAALVAGSIAFLQRQRADHNGEVAVAQTREARLRAVVSDSLALRTTDRDVAALLAVEAHHLSQTASTENALFSTFTGAPGLIRQGHFQGLNASIALALPDNKTVAIADNRGTVHLVEITRATETATLPAVGDSEGVVMMSASADGRWLAVIWRQLIFDEAKTKLVVYDLASHAQRFVANDIPFVPGSVAISAEGSLVAFSGGEEGRIQVRDGASGQLLREVAALPRPATAHLHANTAAVLFAPDGALIVSSQAGPIRWIEPRTGKEKRRITAIGETAEYYLRLSPDSKTLATDGWAGHMAYDVASGRPVWAGPLTDPYCNNMAWSDRLGALVCTDPGTDEVHTLDPATGVSTGTRFEFSTDSVVTPDGSALVETSGTAYSVWRLDGSGPVTSLLTDTGAQWVSGYAPNGDILVGRSGAEVQLVDSLTGAEKGRLAGVEQIIPNPGGGSPAAVYLDHTVGWYDLDRRAPAGPKAPLAFPADQLAPIRDPGTRFLFQGVTIRGRDAVMYTNDSESDGWHLHVRAADLDTGSAVPPTNDAAASDVGAWVFAEKDQSLYRYDWNFDIRALDTQGAVTGSDFGEKYNDVIAGSGGVTATLLAGDVVMLDPATLEPVGAPFPASRGAEKDMALSGDGRRILEVGDLGVRLYDVPTRTEIGEPVPPPDGTPDAVQGFRDRGVALRQDGKAGVALTPDGLVAWDLDPGRWEQSACEIAGRNLTSQEWSKYVGALDSFHAICPQFPATA